MLHLLIGFAALAWWYGIDADGRVTGWVCSRTRPDPYSVGHGADLREGPEPADLRKVAGPSHDRDGVCLWRWPEGAKIPSERSLDAQDADRRDAQRIRWRESLRRYRDAAKLDEEESDAYTDDELKALDREAKRLKDEIDRD